MSGVKREVGRVASMQVHDSNIVELDSIIIERLVASYSRKRDVLDGVTMGFVKWIAASLLAINGAGAIAVLNSELSENVILVSGALFIIGISCGMFFGLKAMYVAVSVTGDPMFVAMLKPGFYNKSELELALNGNEVATGFKDPLYWLGLGSFFSFLAACVTIGAMGY